MSRNISADSGSALSDISKIRCAISTNQYSIDGYSRGILSSTESYHYIEPVSYTHLWCSARIALAEVSIMFCSSTLPQRATSRKAKTRTFCEMCIRDRSKSVNYSAIRAIFCNSGQQSQAELRFYGRVCVLQKLQQLSLIHISARKHGRLGLPAD